MLLCSFLHFGTADTWEGCFSPNHSDPLPKLAGQRETWPPAQVFVSVFFWGDIATFLYAAAFLMPGIVGFWWAPRNLYLVPELPSLQSTLNLGISKYISKYILNLQCSRHSVLRKNILEILIFSQIGLCLKFMMFFNLEVLVMTIEEQNNFVYFWNRL